MNEELLKKETKDLVIGYMNQMKHLYYSNQEIIPQGFFVIATKMDKLMLAPILGFEQFFTSESEKNTMKPKIEVAAKYIKSTFTNGQQIFAFIWISEAWYYETLSATERITPSLHPNKKEALVSNICFTDKTVMVSLPIIRTGTGVFFEPVVILDQDAKISGRFANLLGT